MAGLFLGTQHNRTRQAHERRSAWTSRTSQTFPLLRASVEGRTDTAGEDSCHLGPSAAVSKGIGELQRDLESEQPHQPLPPACRAEPLAAPTAPTEEGSGAGVSQAFPWLHLPLGSCVPVQLVRLPCASSMGEEAPQCLMVASTSSVCGDGCPVPQAPVRSTFCSLCALPAPLGHSRALPLLQRHLRLGSAPTPH